MLEKLFEGTMWRARIFVILAVIFGLLGSIILFIVASVDIYEVLAYVLHVYSNGLHPADFHEVIVSKIIGAVDIYLIAVVMIIFAFGLYELFISKIDAAEDSSKGANILAITSLDQLKDKIAKVVVMVLVVGFFQRVLHTKYDGALEMLYFAISIMVLSVGLYFLGKVGKKEKRRPLKRKLMSKIFVDACLRKETPYTPVWMMRQAGRYLPEYMAVRAKAGNFLNLCHNPEMACEVTIQPLDIVGVDAAILFSDILVIPNEMGMDLEFIKGEGPVFHKPVKSEEDVDALLGGEEAANKLTYVYDTIKLLKQKLPEDKALIGFTGAPWTLATYMIEGQGTKTYNICKKMMYSNPELLHKILKKVTEVVKFYMIKQIEAGADVVQIFDSWAAAIEPSKYDEFSWRYMVEIADYIKSKYPEIPVIMFPKGVSAFINMGGVYGNFDVFGIDWGTPMAMAKEKLGDKYVLQGNMEPCRLYSKEETTKCVEAIQNIMQGEGHIFNLGHGILPDVPVENAIHFVKECQRVSKK